MGRIAIVEAHPGLTEAAYGSVYDLEKLFAA
jgi:hypothetical protein